MKAAVISNPNILEIKELQRPSPADDELVIKIEACGICGTDVHVYRGRYLANYPIIPGHEFSGTVDERGKKARKFQIGDRVAVEPNVACENCPACLNNKQNFCRNWQGLGVTRPGAMAQYVAVPERNTFHIHDLPFEIASFVEPLSCVIHGVQKTKIDLGSKILILGMGNIGSLMLRVVLLRGASEVAIYDRLKSKVDSAVAAGASSGFTDFSSIERDYYDVVIDATGSASVMPHVPEFVAHGGTALLFGVAPKGETMSIEPFMIFKKEINLTSSYISVKNTYQAIELLRTNKLAVNELISDRIPLEDLRIGIEKMEKRGEFMRKIIVKPND